jgi:drug/metabolite transporter (DMT)-like permease
VPLVLLAASLAWATNYAFGSALIDRLDPIAITFWRWLGAAVLLVPLAIIIERPRLATLRRDAWRLLASGILGILCYSTLLYQALRYLDPVDASLISVLNPVFLALTGVLALGEVPQKRLVLGLALAITGVLTVETGGQLLAIFSIPFNMGTFFMILAAGCWVLYSVAARRLRTPPLTATAAQALVTPILLLPVMAITQPAGPQIPHDWWGLAFLAVVPSVLAYGLWNVGTRRGGLASSGLYLTLVPVLTAMLTLMGGTTLTVGQIAGGIIVMVGVIVASPRPGRRPVQ